MADHSPLPQPEPGSVAVVLAEARVRLVLAGELDLAFKAELLEAVREAVRHDRPVEVDTRHVTFMDSSALAALSGLIHRTGHRPIFISPPDMVRFLLQVTRIGELVDVIDDDAVLTSRTTSEPSSPTPTSA